MGGGGEGEGEWDGRGRGGGGEGEGMWHVKAKAVFWTPTLLHVAIQVEGTRGGVH